MEIRRLKLPEISPEGWLLDQLRAQANGLSGNIGKLWYDLSDDSAWLGGKGEAWERGPYYLDGLIPLAYILKDEKLIGDAQKWVNAIIDSQDKSGFFGPVRSKDWWSRILALKALIPYYDATGDNRILAFFRNFFIYQMREMDNFPFFMWAQARAYEELIPLKFYIDTTGDNSVMPLVNKLRESSLNWFAYFERLPYTEPTRRYLSRTVINLGRTLGARPDREKKYGNTPIKEISRRKILFLGKTAYMRKLMMTHGVNIAMAIKYPALYGQFDGNDYHTLTKKGLESLMKHHGLSIGLFTSNEHLDGPDPTKGTELCTVVEAMYSFEHLLEKTGDPYYADLLELIAYNALPATFTADMTAHQYLQQVNQISATIAKRDYFDTGNDANIFGLEPNFGCCAANMHQGFPKLVTSLAHKTQNGLAFMVYAPCRIETHINAEKFVIHESTEYPFRDRIVFTIEKAPTREISLTFRVPAHTSLTIGYNGSGVLRGEKGTLSLKRAFSAGDKIELFLNAPVKKRINPDGSISFIKGSLLLASKLNHKKIIYKGEPPFMEQGFVTDTPWNYSPLLIRESVKINNFPLSRFPFDEASPPLEVVIPARKVLNWKEKRNSAPLPAEPLLSQNEDMMVLVPYGCTRVRIAQFPSLKK